MRKLAYILVVFFIMIGNSICSQNTHEKDFDVDAYLDSINFFGDNESSEETEIEEVVENDYEDAKIQKNYLESNQELKHFDDLEWEKIKKSIVEGNPESEYYYDPNGTRMNDSDNPFKKSRNARYWKGKRGEGYKVKKIPKKRKKYRDRRRRGSYSGSFLGSGVGMVLLVIIVIGLAVLIFFMFFKNPTKKGKKKIIYDITEMSPADIPKTELELLLDKAIKNEDYREAIRIYFVFLIKGLVRKDFIVWEKEKTNFSYLNEMRDNKLYKEFDQTIYIYETIWYGERNINKQEFNKLQPKFTRLLTKIDVR